MSNTTKYKRGKTDPEQIIVFGVLAAVSAGWALLTRTIARHDDKDNKGNKENKDK